MYSTHSTDALSRELKARGIGGWFVARTDASEISRYWLIPVVSQCTGIPLGWTTGEAMESARAMPIDGDRPALATRLIDKP